jgi:hypothetical protein
VLCNVRSIFEFIKLKQVVMLWQEKKYIHPAVQGTNNFTPKKRREIGTARWAESKFRVMINGCNLLIPWATNQPAQRDPINESKSSHLLSSFELLCHFYRSARRNPNEITKVEIRLLNLVLQYAHCSWEKANLIIVKSYCDKILPWDESKPRLDGSCRFYSGLPGSAHIKFWVYA